MNDTSFGLVPARFPREMRVYMHFEQEEPNHTAALTAAGPEATLDDLLEDFLRSYLEHYGEGAADLDTNAVELRSSKCASHLPVRVPLSSPCGTLPPPRIASSLV